MLYYNQTDYRPYRNLSISYHTYDNMDGTMAWFYLLEAVVIVIVNVFTIVVLMSTPRLRSRKHALIVNVAVADLLVALIPMPIWIYFHIGPHAFTLYLPYKRLDMLLGTASLFGLAALAIEWAYATYYPLKHRTLTQQPYIYIVVIGVAWVCAFLVTFVTHYSVYRLSDYAIITAAILSPLVIVVMTSVLMCVKVFCKKSIDNQYHAIHRMNKSVTITLTILSIAAMITWIPFMVLSAYHLLCWRCSNHIPKEAMASAKFLHYSNSFLKCFVYALCMPDFKNEILRQMRLRPANPPQHQNEIEMPNDIGRGGNELEMAQHGEEHGRSNFSTVLSFDNPNSITNLSGLQENPESVLMKSQNKENTAIETEWKDTVEPSEQCMAEITERAANTNPPSAHGKTTYPDGQTNYGIDGENDKRNANSNVQP